MRVILAALLTVIEHASFFGTTLVHGGLLGALLTLAPRPLYIWYTGRSGLWGFSPLEDQQLAGLLMWVPMGVVYLGACIVFAGRLVASPEERLGAAARARMQAQSS